MQAESLVKSALSSNNFLLYIRKKKRKDIVQEDRAWRHHVNKVLLHIYIFEKKKKIICIVTR